MVIKPRIFRTYKMLPTEMAEQLKLIYPKGFEQHLISIKNLSGEMNMALRFTTAECVYFISLSRENARQIIMEDDDYNSLSLLVNERKLQIFKKYPNMKFILKLNENIDNLIIDASESSIRIE